MSYSPNVSIYVMPVTPCFWIEHFQLAALSPILHDFMRILLPMSSSLPSKFATCGTQNFLCTCLHYYQCSWTFRKDSGFDYSRHAWHSMDWVWVQAKYLSRDSWCPHSTRVKRWMKELEHFTYSTVLIFHSYVFQLIMLRYAYTLLYVIYKWLSRDSVQYRQLNLINSNWKSI
jgi:hypothetical protein